MIRPIQQQAVPQSNPTRASAATPDLAQQDQVQKLSADKAQLGEELQRLKTELTAALGREKALVKQIDNLASKESTYQQKVTELEQKLTTLSTPTQPAVLSPTSIILLGIGDDAKAEGMLSATVKLDNLPEKETAVLFSADLETARKLLRRVKEA